MSPGIAPVVHAPRWGGIGRRGLSQFDHAVAEERIQAFAEAA
jgi:hypothetical protein